MRESFHSNIYDKNYNNLSESAHNLIAREEKWLDMDHKKDLEIFDEKLIINNNEGSKVLKSNVEKKIVYIYAFLIGLMLNIYSVLIVKLK